MCLSILATIKLKLKIDVTEKKKQQKKQNKKKTTVFCFICVYSQTRIFSSNDVDPAFRRNFNVQWNFIDKTTIALHVECDPNLRS